MLKQLIENFESANYTRVSRGADSYAESETITVSELDRLVAMYHLGGGPQTLRLVRDAIDHWLRRYHGYAIQGSIGAHYRQVGLKEKGIFEHVVPASRVRDMLIAGILTPVQAMNMPTCQISNAGDRTLRQAGLVSTTPSVWNFFKRYEILQSNFETHNGTPVDVSNWNLEKHFKLFGVE
jgi:hypothetical protein